MQQQKIDILGAETVPEFARDEIIDRALEAVRGHLGMTIAYLSEFVEDKVVFRHVNAPGQDHLITAGSTRALEETYCRHILDGRMPEVIADTALVPLAQELPITHAAPIGSHVSLPVHRADGSIYGMFCALSPDPTPTLNERDLSVMRLFAGLAADQVRAKLDRENTREEARHRIEAALTEGTIDMVFQPIYRLSDGGLSSLEALARFRSDPYRPPDQWFEDARLADLQLKAETHVIEATLDRLDEVPQGVRLSVNAAPDTVASGALLRVFRKVGGQRLTVEITEHQQCTDFATLVDGVAALRRLGTTVAVDDVGAGYSGLQQILSLRPDIIKLDRALVQDIDRDPAKVSLTVALVHFARDTGAMVVAEGIERAEERDTLRGLNVDCGQGFLLGRPGPLEAVRPTIDLRT